MPHPTLSGTQLPGRRLWLAVGLLLLALGSGSGCVCFGPAPGKGKTAALGYARSAPVIEALKIFRLREEAYPKTLEALVAAGDLARVPGRPDDGPVGYRYRLAPPSYKLTFSYAGPGMNECSYTPETAWSCFGYF